MMARRRDRGFALLLVFMMAAVVAIMLYVELPRVAFEAQRNREELLVARGEQYQRAIQLFFRRFSRYPPTMEALENTNNIRFLRRRYKDPMTGKDEWRLIHAGPGGMLTDSLVQKAPDPNSKDPNKPDADSALNTGAATAGSGVPLASDPNAQQPGRGSRRRADMTGGYFGAQSPGGALTDAQGNVLFPGQPGYPAGDASQAGQLAQPTDQLTQNPGFQPGQQGGVPGDAAAAAGQLPPGFPGQVIPGQEGAQPGVPPGVIPLPGRTGSSPAYQQTQTNFGMPIGGPQSMFQGGMQPGGSTGQTANSGLGPAGPAGVPLAIQNLLTTPRQQPTTSSSGAQTIGGGIAGVASTADQEGIKVYNDRSNYKEWEFVYDIRKDPRMMGAGMGQLAPAGTQPGGLQQNQPAQTDQPKP